MKVCVIGTGYVGLTTSVALAYLGHQVIGVDKDTSKIELLLKHQSPIREYGLERLMEMAWGNLRFSTSTRDSVSDAGIIIIAVGTPSGAGGGADTAYVETAAREIAQGMKPDSSYTVVVKSTVPVGSNKVVSGVVREVLDGRGLRNKTSVGIVSNPEFLREGMALNDTLYPDRIVVGAETQEQADSIRRLYREILEQTFEAPHELPRPEHYRLPPFISTDPASAEMIKYAANAFLALKISYINEIAGLCEKVGADAIEVARGIGLDHRIGQGFLSAGIGWGGSCLPKDTSALLASGKEHGYSMPITEAAREVNARQRDLAIEKIHQALHGVCGRTLGILGLSFKPGTDDVRDSPALDLVRIFATLGARIRVHDPLALENTRAVLDGLKGFEIEYFEDPYKLVSGADALILATDWPEYKLLDWARIAGLMGLPLILDGRNLLDPKEMKRAGWSYTGVGRPIHSNWL
ncbi:MAG TPA: UDP-glucose/GDP-mannose dehydrogenase family protein [Firmicutes bacterium]|jgi:UDPglucose 6-dehydrogenase|nr:UDP-glucose/GDP-mannose dehydrogenase family protein [Bacillota bacterium]